nr:MMPL family transporter [Kibdelosporangium sp. MJ126-NF4]CEL14129.1 possible membrane protein [Kibdelosporangium sp. MJ126-NF4]CTQ88496.1 possible membrane protein [Kibdelosporangium sp. MJ126-NF4]
MQVEVQNVTKHEQRNRPGPVRWVLPALVIIAWLVFGAVGGGLPGKLAEVQTNDGVSFLPANAEATEVTHLQEKFAGGKIQPALVLYSRDGGLAAGDAQVAADRVARIAQLPGLAGPASPPVNAPRGEALQVVVPVSGVDGFETGKTVEKMRDIAAENLPAGLRVNITGPAGFTADFGEVFGGIDGQLLVITAIVVVVILILVYRSPLLPIVVLASAGFALVLSSAVVYPLAHDDLITLNGQSQGILFILVFGASTDYALLLVARYREELLVHTNPWQAILAAVKASFESIAASAGTVILGLLCLLFSELSSNKGLGPVAAIGIAASLIASLTFLPAALALLGRAAFWPTSANKHHKPGMWHRLAELVGRRFRPVWIVTALVLAALAALSPMLKSHGVSQNDVFLDRTDAVVGQEVLARHFPGGAGTPVVIVVNEPAAAQVVAAAKVPGVADVAANPKVVDGKVEVDAVLQATTDSPEAQDTLGRIREAVRAVPGADAKVGGQTAISTEVRDAAERDRMVIIPIVLVVIFLVLALLLRALLAPLVLIATVVLSFAATLGVAAMVFNHVLDFPGSDPSVPLYAFVFLVALGIDYNIFLMTRVREESHKDGTRAGTLHALAVTGGVITSAGVVLAATFAALSVLPILFMAQIAFLVAFGVLLDTLIVRSLLVPALTLDIGRRIWWPGKLRRGEP